MNPPLSRLLRRPVAVSMASGAVVLAGLLAFIQLPIELAPSIDFPSLTIVTSWAHASPETVEQIVTAPIEAVVNTVAGVKNVRSRSSEGRSSVDVEFEQGTNMNFARLELYEKLAALAEGFPVGVGSPVLVPYVPEDFKELQGFLSFSLASDMTAAALRSYATEHVQPALLGIRGVSRVQILDGEERELQVHVNPKRVAAFGLTVQEILQALRTAEVRAPVGIMQRADTRVVLSVHNAYARADDILDLPLRTRGGTLLRLRDVATVHDTVAETRSIYRIDGKPSITLVVDKEPHINTLEVADRVVARLNELVAAFPGQLSLTKVVDKSEQMRVELQNLRREVVFSIACIWLVLVVALGSLSAPLVLMSSIVLSLAGTLLVFWLLGLSLHLLTLAGLVLGFGRVVDDAIVVADNIQRHNRKAVSDAGIVAAVSQVRLPVIASTMTTVGALLPIAFLPEDLRPYFKEFALAVGIALIMSLIVSFTVIPMILRNLPGAMRSSSTFERIGDWVLVLYRRMLGACLNRRKVVISVVALAFGLPVWLLPDHVEGEHLPARLYNAVFSNELMITVRPYLNSLLGGASYLFFTKVTKGEVWEWGNETYLVVRVGFPQGTELQRYDDVARMIEREVSADRRGVSRVTTRISDEYASVRIDFDEQAAMTALPYIMKNRLTVLAAQTGGAAISVAGFGPGFYTGGESAPSFYVKVLGYNYAKVKELAEQFKERLERNPRVAEVDIDRTFVRWPKSTELVMRIDRQALVAHHLTVAELMPWFGTMTRGIMDWQSLTLGNDRLPLVVKMQGFEAMTVEDVALERLVNARGETVPFGTLVTVHERRVMSEILREDQQYVRWISFEYRGPYRYGDQFVDRTIRSMSVPHGYRFEREQGWFVLHEKEKISLVMIAVLAALIVFMVTAALYESLMKPLLIMVALPFSLIGLFVAFYFTDTPFGRGGYGALFFLVGVVVTNAIVLVDYVAGFHAALPASREEFLHRCSERVRPILMTSATTVAALVPLLVWSKESSIWYSLSLGVVGGLASSTLLVLFVVPVLLSVFRSTKLQVGER